MSNANRIDCCSAASSRAIAAALSGLLLFSAPTNSFTLSFSRGLEPSFRVFVGGGVGSRRGGGIEFR